MGETQREADRRRLVEALESAPWVDEVDQWGDQWIVNRPARAGSIAEGIVDLMLDTLDRIALERDREAVSR